MTLTTGLILLAALVLLGLLGQAAWAARRAGGVQPRRSASPDTDVHPELGLESLEAAGRADVVDTKLGGVEASVLWHEPPRPQLLRRSARIDALIDAIATLTPESPVSGDLVLQHQNMVRRAGNKAMHIEAFHADTDAWELPVPGRRYEEVQVAVQLVNRHGALNEIEFSDFAHQVQSLGETLRALVDLPDMIEAVTRARELDAFCSQHDLQLVVHLLAQEAAWSLGFLHQCAAKHGFVSGPVSGRMVLASMEEDAPPVLVLSYDAQAALAEDPGEAAIKHLTLSLDLPQTPRESEPFGTWQACARRLAEDLGAQLVDDQGAPLTLHAFTSIGEALEWHYQQLASHELAAGSPAARRLFS